MQLHQVQPKTPNRKPKTVGRGGKRGTTSGRGTKGQRARSGHRIRPEFRDILKKLPKRRGHGISLFNTNYKPTVAIVNLDQIEKSFAVNEVVSPVSLEAKGLISAANLLLGRVKILGRGEVSKALIVRDCFVSASVVKSITAAGGKVEAKVAAGKARITKTPNKTGKTK